MTLLILTETPIGYALLKASDKNLLKENKVAEKTQTAQDACELLKFKKFEKFESSERAVEEFFALGEGKVTPTLAKLLEDVKNEKKVSLAVADHRLGHAITKALPNLNITPIADSSTEDLFRAVRTHLTSLIPGLKPDEVSAFSLGLSHSLARHKLKFSPDKVDTMIIHAISTLDELDKELNTYAMRLREWYGWHFPEMAKTVNDNLAYAKVVKVIGMRSGAIDADLSEILPEDWETKVKEDARMSMGSDLTENDLDTITALATQVVGLYEDRQTLSNYLSARMQAIAPNLTALVGDLVGARLISKAGSLLNLSKNPASTIQILGAEKALFRALKTKHDTPKYGLIYHASLVGQATGKNKGKVARILAAKASLGIRVDSLSDWGVSGERKGAEPTEEEKASVGNAHRLNVERRLRKLEGKPLGPRGGTAIGPAGQTQPAKFELKQRRTYNPDADGLAKNAAALAEDSDAEVDAGPSTKLIQEVNGDKKLNGHDEKVNGASSLKRKQSSDDEEDEEDEPESESKAEKKARKAAKKAEKEARKAEKRAKKAAKLAQQSNGDDVSSKKRKHDDADEARMEKKKKKKHRAEE